MDGVTTSTLGASFTQVVFNLELSPSLLRNGVYLALSDTDWSAEYSSLGAQPACRRLAFR